jgi:nucleotide-binding universal stress UspA family protein
MKHILVAMDLSPLSDRAFDRAVQLAEAHKAKLTLVHVIDDQILRYAEEDSSLEAVLVRGAEERLKRHWAALPETVAGRFHRIIRTGSPWETVVAVARDEGCDLIVLGLHRTNPLRDMFIGTTAERIIRSSTVPVLVVKDKPVGPYRQVAVGTDFSPCSSHALRAAMAVAPEARFQLFHVFEMPFPALIHFRKDEVDAWRQERIDKAAEQVRLDLDHFLGSHVAGKGPEISTMVEQGDVGTVVAGILRDQQSDLLVFGTHGRTGIPGALIGSVAASFLNDPPCDVLVSR